MSLMNHAVTSRALSQELVSFAGQQQFNDVCSSMAFNSETMGPATLDAASKFCLQHQDGHIRVWRYRGERTLAVCIGHRHFSLSPDIMVGAGAIGYTSRSPLVRIDDTLNSERYITDLSPIENIWSMITQRLTRHQTPVTTIDELWPRVEAAWASVPIHAIQSLFDSMARRISAGTTSRAGCSGY
ncbi:odorant receptor [Trichonephila clavipes]|nr:odorant receptor [Trichonephila clavipes]